MSQIAIPKLKRLFEHAEFLQDKFTLSTFAVTLSFEITYQYHRSMHYSIPHDSLRAQSFHPQIVGDKTLIFLTHVSLIIHFINSSN
jgi:hypothetical protein